MKEETEQGVKGREVEVEKEVGIGELEAEAEVEKIEKAKGR